MILADSKPDPTRKKADQYSHQAENKLQEPKGLLEVMVCYLSGPNNRKEEALAKFREAAVEYKRAKEWMKAGDAYLRVIDVALILKLSSQQLGSNYLNAAHCFLKDPAGLPQGKLALEGAVKCFCDMGDWPQASAAQIQFAEMLESNSTVSLDEIRDAWSKAADLNEADSSIGNRNSCLKKVASIYCQQKNFLEAALVYESIGQSILKNDLLKLGVKEHWKNASICRLSLGDIVQVKKLNEKHCYIQQEYSETRECKLIKNLIVAVENHDAAVFEKHVAQYHKITPFEDWQFKILADINTVLEGDSEEEPDPDLS